MLKLIYRQMTILILGIVSGLPLALSASTLQAWFAVSGLDVVAVSSLGVVGQPYLFKFLWAPLLDKAANIPMGRRRGWMLISQVAIIVILLAMSFLHPQEHPYQLAFLGLCLAFASATQDVAIDAYRADILPANERGLGGAMAVGGYRLGMLLSGGVALILADYLGWALLYQLMALTMVFGMVMVIFAEKPPKHEAPPQTVLSAISEPLREFFSRPKALHFIALIVLFKLGEVFTSTSGIMTNTFLLQGLGFDLTTVGQINKIVGLFAVLAGIFIGGLLMMRMTVYNALMTFGLLQAASNLMFVALSMVGKSKLFLIMVVIIDNLCAGLGNAALIALLMSLCDHRYTATQYALLSAIAVAGRVLLGPPAGYAVAAVGWTVFFMWTVVLALPAVILAWWMKSQGITAEVRAGLTL